MKSGNFHELGNSKGLIKLE